MALTKDIEKHLGITLDRDPSKEVTLQCHRPLKPGTSRKSNVNRNRRKSNPMGKQKYGVRVPRNVKEAKKLDKENGNTLLQDAIVKEISVIWSMGTFKLMSKVQRKNMKRYQYTPLRIIFDVKQDGHRKARLVIGGHVVDATGHDVYASNMKTISARVLMLIAIANQLDVITGDIGNAYLFAKSDMDVYVSLGEEFHMYNADIPIGARAIVQQARYGLPTSANPWHAHLADTLRMLDFKPTQYDPDVWYRYSGGDCYDYVSTHTDDLMIVAKDARGIMAKLEETYTIKNIGPPKFHLGCDYHCNTNATWSIGTETYVKEALEQVQDLLGKQSLGQDMSPMDQKWEPELSAQPFLPLDGHHLFQQLIGIAQWLITCGRMDLYYSISLLS
ncbi:hypothetical protein TI03_03165 [Achromatium sp. WMS1]|nr:hypothetical protein TI03_03165 [Achromatium sp. WMS1]